MLPESVINRLEKQIAEIKKVLEPIETERLKIGEPFPMVSSQDRHNALIQHLKRCLDTLQQLVDYRDA